MWRAARFLNLPVIPAEAGTQGTPQLGKPPKIKRLA
jgi:hypothetical protein